MRGLGETDLTSVAESTEPSSSFPQAHSERGQGVLFILKVISTSRLLPVLTRMPNMPLAEFHKKLCSHKHMKIYRIF